MDWSPITFVRHWFFDWLVFIHKHTMVCTWNDTCPCTCTSMRNFCRMACLRIPPKMAAKQRSLRKPNQRRNYITPVENIILAGTQLIVASLVVHGVPINGVFYCIYDNEKFVRISTNRQAAPPTVQQGDCLWPARVGWPTSRGGKIMVSTLTTSVWQWGIWFQAGAASVFPGQLLGPRVCRSVLASKSLLSGIWGSFFWGSVLASGNLLP